MSFFLPINWIILEKSICLIIGAYENFRGKKTAA